MTFFNNFRDMIFWFYTTSIKKARTKADMSTIKLKMPMLLMENPKPVTKLTTISENSQVALELTNLFEKE